MIPQRSTGDSSQTAGSADAGFDEAAAYALDLCARIAACTDVPGTITRTFLSPATREVHALLRAEMQALGMAVRVDCAGNLRGMYAGQQDGAPVLLMGSHIDTVPDAGAYDGILGVAVTLALLRSLAGRGFPFAIELIAFSEEEGVRFALPFIGSRALLGSLGVDELARQDAAGISAGQALRDFGLDADRLLGADSDARLTPGTFAFVEVHIEQGPVLEAAGSPLGLVLRVVGQTRLAVEFEGEANHAGTTPMEMRRDALAAAAEFMVAVEGLARAREGLVATVGTIRALPGAVNIIPGSVSLSLDVRHGSDPIREETVRELIGIAERIAATRRLRTITRETSRQDSVEMDQMLTRLLRVVAPDARAMDSGAGHDAMILAPVMPAAMLFVRSPGGVSHNPAEAVLPSDVQCAIDVCRRLVEKLAEDDEAVETDWAGG